MQYRIKFKLRGEISYISHCHNNKDGTHYWSSGNIYEHDIYNLSAARIIVLSSNIHKYPQHNNYKIENE